MSKRFVLPVAILFVLLVAHPVQGQWTQVFTFPGSNYITSIYFLDEVGVPTTGFVGIGPDIYRTVNGGTLWTQVQSGLAGPATSFCFKDVNVGWCTAGNSNNTPSIYKTMDGGKTWAPLGIFGSGSDVFYNPTNGLLFLSNRQSSSVPMTSSDDGATWKPIVNQINENGFAFCDSLHGILTSLDNPFDLTSDGGKTWYNLGYVKHSWSPAAIPGSSTYIAAGDITNSIYSSTDTGNTWHVTATITGDLTGCVQTGPCSVYVQSSEGIFYSTDLVQWLPLGGPGTTFDTRFFVGSNLIYAADGIGKLYTIPTRGDGWPTLRFSPEILHFSVTPGCSQKIDSLTFQNISCLPLIILSARLTDSTRWDIKTGAMFPDTLRKNDSLQISIGTAVDTSGIFRDALDLLIKTSAGITDTEIVLNLVAASIVPPTIRAPAISLPNSCTTKDSTFFIRNNHCDTIHITAISMLDSSLFALLPFQLPIELPPDSQCTIPFTTEPKSKGSFGDSVSIVVKTKESTLDTSFVLRGDVGGSAILATFSSQSFAFDTVFGCTSEFDTIYIRNNSCDSFQITQESLATNSFLLADSVLDTWIPSGDSTEVVLELSGNTLFGDFTDTLGIRLNNGSIQKYFSLPVIGSVRRMPIFLFFNPDSIHADSITECSPFDTTIFLTAQTVCDSILVSSVNYIGSGNVSVNTVPLLPRTLHTGDTVKCNVVYIPTTHGTVDGEIQAKGIGLDTSIPFHLFVRNDAKPIQLSISKTAFSAPLCGSDSAMITLSNLGCETVVLDSLSLRSGMSNYTLDSLSLPRILPTDSSISMMLYFSSNSSNDTSFPIVDTIDILDQTGNREKIGLSGIILPISIAHLGIAIAPGSTLTPVVGGTTDPLLYFSDTVTSVSDLTSVHCLIKFNGDLLTEFEAPAGLSGWNIQENPSSAGTIDLLCSRSNKGAISPGTPIASLSLQASLSDSLSTPISLTSVTFTPSEPDYEQCILRSSISPPSINIYLSPRCGDSLILQQLRDKPILTSVEVLPEKNNLFVTFQSRASGVVSVELHDILGRLHTAFHSTATIGINEITIPSSNLRQGIYFVEISEMGTRITKQVAILR